MTGIQTITPVELSAHHALSYTISGEIYLNARMNSVDMNSNLENNYSFGSFKKGRIFD